MKINTYFELSGDEKTTNIRNCGTQLKWYLEIEDTEHLY